MYTKLPDCDINIAEYNYNIKLAKGLYYTTNKKFLKLKKILFYKI
ncbi:hypothetical protein SAMN04488553_2070 [Gramella sp. MAR_2010_147]|nr:hypothetical protein SAMN04488553_2070 [Gramella sp. MAR_2010_147]